MDCKVFAISLILNKDPKMRNFGISFSRCFAFVLVLSQVVGAESHARSIALKVYPNVRWFAAREYIGYFDTKGEAFAALIAEKERIFERDLSHGWPADKIVGGYFVSQSNVVKNGLDTVYSCRADRYRWVDNVLVSRPEGIWDFGAALNCPEGSHYKFENLTPDGKQQKVWCEWVVETRERQPDQCEAENSMHPESGLKVQRERDYQSANGVLGLERTYRSDSGTFTSYSSRSIGFSNYQSSDVGAACVQGVDLESTSTLDSPFGEYIHTYRSICYRIYPSDSKKALLSTPTGQLIEFNVNGDTASPSSGSSETATKVETFAKALTAKRGLAAATEPSWIVTREGRRLDVYASSGRLLSSWTMDGKKASFVYSDETVSADIAPGPGYLLSQSDDFGRAVSFTYDGAGNMATMRDPTGQLYRYDYNIENRLTAVRYPNGLTVGYSWNEPAQTGGANLFNALTGRTESWNGIDTRVGTYSYDSDGNSLSTEDAGGSNRFVVSDRQRDRVTVTDPLGASRTLQFTTINEVPYVTATSQPAGSGCAASQKSSVYDALGNRIVSDDFAGNRTCSEYRNTRNLETTRVEGLSGSVACAGVIATGASLPAGSRKISRAWHPEWRVETSRAEPKRRTDWVYNGQSDPSNGGAPANCAPATAKLPNGKPIAVLCKVVEQATTDERGELGLTAASVGTPRVSSFTYNQFGQVLTSTDPRGYTTAYKYYDSPGVDYLAGDLQSETNPVGHVTQYLRYDRSGRLLKVIDPNGVVSEMSYTPRGWLNSITVAPGGGSEPPQTTTYSYDGIGNVLQTSFPDGTTLNYVYDAGHRLIGVSDTAGNHVTYELDAAGNRVGEQVQDVSGVLARNITRSFDALGRLQQVTGSAQ